MKAESEDGATPVHFVRGVNQLEIVREMVQQGANVYARNNGRFTPLFEVASHPVKTYLLQLYQESIFQREGRHALHSILKEGDYNWRKHVGLKLGRFNVAEMISVLGHCVARDPDCIRERDGNGDLPIHIACSKRAPVRVIQYLLQQDSAQLRIPNNDGALPIHLACRANAWFETIRYLVERNGGTATLSTQDGSGALPLHALCEASKPSLKTAEYLIQAYPTALSTATHSGDLPASLACQSDASVIVIYALVRGYPQFVEC